MKKHIFSIILSTLLSLMGSAQISLQATIPAVGLFQKNQLWNVIVINSSVSSYECKLKLLIKDRNTGQDVLTASSGQFVIDKGAKQLNINALGPVVYNYISPGMDTKLQELMPAGSYMACYTLSLLSGKSDLADDCIQFDVEPLTLPMLTFPSDSSQLQVAPSQFTWTPPAPAGMFNRLHYQILVTPINPGQKAEEAIQQNLPFYSNENVMMNMFNYPVTAETFEKNKWYAWQVTARDDNNYAGKSETWTFIINNTPPVPAIVEQAPFLKMTKSNPQKGIAPNGVLKLSYVNETSDTTARIKIIDVRRQHNTSTEITIPLKPGENLIQYNLSKKLNLKEGNVYEAQLVNSRNEKWVMQFEFHTYKVKETNN
jgi:hypothetical protein